MSNITINTLNNNLISLDSKIDDRKNNELDINTWILFNKIIKNIKDFYDIYIENKHIKIVKYKVMTSIIQKLEEIYNNL